MLLYTVLDASLPVFWASVGDSFGRKSFGAIRGNILRLGSHLGSFAAGMIYDRTKSYALFSPHYNIAADPRSDDFVADRKSRNAAQMPITKPIRVD